MNPRFTPGTRVRIVRATYSDQQRFNGQEGVVTEATPRANGTVSYVVRVDTTGDSIWCREVSAIPEPEVIVREGDRVRIDNVLFTRDRMAALGQIGLVTKITSAYPGRPVTYLVVVGTQEFTATDVHVVTPAAQVAPAAEAPMPVEVNVKRAQAATFAHGLLGQGADLDDVIALATFVAAEDGKVAPASLGTVYVDVQATPTPDLDADRLLFNNLQEFNGVEVRRDRSADNDVLRIEAGYLQEEHIPGLIAYLQAALRVTAVEGPNPNAPRNGTPPF